MKTLQRHDQAPLGAENPHSELKFRRVSAHVTRRIKKGFSHRKSAPIKKQQQKKNI